MNKPNIQNNIDSISSFQNGLNDPFSSPGFYFKSKVIEGNHKGKIIYFWLFGHFFLKCTFLWLWHFFLLSGYPTKFWVALHIYKIHVFVEAFFLLTIRMSIATKLFRVVTCEELSPINIHDTSMEWSYGVMWQIKYISPHLQKI